MGSNGGGSSTNTGSKNTEEKTSIFGEYKVPTLKPEILTWTNFEFWDTKLKQQLELYDLLDWIDESTAVRPSTSDPVVLTKWRQRDALT